MHFYNEVPNIAILAVISALCTYINLISFGNVKILASRYKCMH